MFSNALYIFHCRTYCLIFTDIIRYGGFVYNRAVLRSGYDYSRIKRQSDHAHDDGHYCGTGNGHNGYNRAQRGRKMHGAGRKIIGNTITLFMGIAVAFTVILVVLVKPIVVLIATPQEAVAGTSIYLLICFIGIPFITAYNIISSIFRGLGDSKSPMYFIGIACVMNIALDYLFMGAFHMGAAGAALGTVCAQTFSVLVALWVIRRRKTGIFT